MYLFFFCVLFIVHGCTVFCCGDDDALEQTERIMQYPEILESTGKNTINDSLSDYGHYMIPESIKHIKQYFSKGYKKRICKYLHGMLQYGYYGDIYVHPLTNEKKQAYMEFMFIETSGKWRLHSLFTREPPRDALPDGH
jgi:hypothetical protein